MTKNIEAAMLQAELVATAMEATVDSINDALEYVLEHKLDVDDVTVTYCDCDYCVGSEIMTAHVIKASIYLAGKWSLLPTLKWTSDSMSNVEYGTACNDSFKSGIYCLVKGS